LLRLFRKVIDVRLRIFVVIPKSSFVAYVHCYGAQLTKESTRVADATKCRNRFVYLSSVLHVITSNEARENSRWSSVTERWSVRHLSDALDQFSSSLSEASR
jgi:hypothetical protein